MATPIRVQRRRAKGWRMPADTVCVTRPGAYGNPFRVGGHYRRDGGGIPRMGMHFVFVEAYEGHQDATFTTIKTADEAIAWFRWYVTAGSPEQWKKKLVALRGKNLACWCRLDQPCHADVLLELANAVAQSEGR